MSIAKTTSETILSKGIIDDNDQTRARIEHLRELENIIGNSYPNKFARTRITGTEDTISNILAFDAIAELAKELQEKTPDGEKPNQELKENLNAKLKNFGNVRVSGRLAVPPRMMGKAAFVHLSDGRERLQVYVRRDDAKVISNDTGKVIEQENAAWEVFKLLDHGDFVGAEGFLFLTNTGELSVHVETLQFLSKALLPMPDKMHGIADPELRRRYRYADLIASSLQVEHEGLTTREVFERRARLISGMRRYLDEHGYIEVETPMLTPKATGAAATPFETHHNALDIPLYARIAPELYLKRLTVGGFEKVYELNRNFRNEGLSHKHNPEFTMLEFYCAYMDVNGMMDFAEAMIKESVQKATGSLVVNYDGREIDFSKFERLTMKESIVEYLSGIFNPVLKETLTVETLDDLKQLRQLYAFYKWLDYDVSKSVLFSDTDTDPESELFETESNELYRKLFIKHRSGYWQKAIEFAETTPSEEKANEIGVDLRILKQIKKVIDGKTQDSQKAKIVENLFGDLVEEKLIQPTFIIDYPKSISPLSKASPENPQIAERFELFINGMEVANGFSELNDPQEQYERFVEQTKARESGDQEAMVLDEDYIRALSYGMPPAAGIGIGIDRLVMLLTNRHSIRDVILFPHMRPESPKHDEPEQ